MIKGFYLRHTCAGLLHALTRSQDGHRHGLHQQFRSERLQKMTPLKFLIKIPLIKGPSEGHALLTYYKIHL